jgi:DNA polymerase III delta prime subunit
VLRFYADKARRHHLPDDRYVTIVAEIDRMVERGGEYSFSAADDADRGWVFCPEFSGSAPLEISAAGRGTRIFLFGPGFLPDSDLYGPNLSSSAGSDESADIHSTRPNVEVLDSEPSPELSDGSVEARKEARQTDVGGQIDDRSSPSIRLGTDLLTGSAVGWPVTVKGNPHLLVAGLPGMGKTTCLLNLCQQMLQCEIRPIVFSYHHDIDERLEQLVSKVRFLDFHGLDFNPLRVIDRGSRMAYLDVAGAIRDIFVAIFPEIGDIQGESIRKAIKDSFIELGWGEQDADLLSLTDPTFGRFLEILRSDPKPDRGLRTLLARLEELDDYGFFQVSQSTESLWESEQPTIIRIHTTQNNNLQKAFASLIFYWLYKDMFRRGIQDHITHAVVFDEARRAARLRLVPTMAKECRKYGISLILASQEAKDFKPSLFSAIANYLVLRLNEADAKTLVRNVCSSDQERVLVDKLKQMDRFRALYFCEGNKRPTYLSLPP